ncbi:MAG: TIR domain-containing protein [Planctomycetota bacterium]
MTDQPENKYELFISYAHRDNHGNTGDQLEPIQAVKLAIEQEYRAVTGKEVNIFLDVNAIETGEYWRTKILTGLKSSKMLLAFVSDNYFRSEYCRLEWEQYVQTEIAQALPGDGILPIYIVKSPSFDENTLERHLRKWSDDLKRRQLDIRWLDWWPFGQETLEQSEVKERLRELTTKLKNRLSFDELRLQSPTNEMPVMTLHFKGRHREMHELRSHLKKGNVGAITALNGVPGIGKTELAIAYAWGYGAYYPGGRFYLNMAGQCEDDAQVIERLKVQLAKLAPYKNIPVSQAEQQDIDRVYAKVLAEFQKPPIQPTLLILDNVDDRRFLDPALLAQYLPKGDDIDIVITTRLPRLPQGRLEWVAVDFLDIEDGQALLESIVPIPSDWDEARQNREQQAACRISERLGGHAQALTVVGIYMRLIQENSYEAVEQYLSEQGIELINQMGSELDRQQISLDSTYTEKVIEQLLVPTLEKLKQEEPLAYQALQIAAFFPPDYVPIPWIVQRLEHDTAGLNPTQAMRSLSESQAKRALRLLVDYRFLVPNRQRTSSLVSDTVEIQLRIARIHRLYAEILKKECDADLSRVLEALVWSMANSRSQEVARDWGREDLVWEVEPLLATADADPKRQDYSYVFFLDQVCELLWHQGRVGDLKRLRARGLSVMEHLSKAAPENADYARDLSVSYERLGDLSLALGDASKAGEYYQKALDVRLRLSKAAPENADYARDLWVSYWRCASHCESTGDPSAASSWWQLAYNTLQKMVDKGLFVSGEDLQYLDAIRAKLN